MIAPLVLAAALAGACPGRSEVVFDAEHPGASDVLTANERQAWAQRVGAEIDACRASGDVSDELAYVLDLRMQARSIRWAAASGADPTQLRALIAGFDSFFVTGRPALIAPAMSNEAESVRQHVEALSP